MPAAPIKSRDEARRALALIRRLAQPARGLLDMLAEAEARVIRPAPVDALIAAPAPPEVLARLLGGSSSTGPEPRRDRPGPVQPALRSLSKPSPLKPAGRTADWSAHDGEVPGAGPTRTTRTKAVENVRYSPERDPGTVEPAKGMHRSRDRASAAVTRKPVGLKDVADMRRAQRHALTLPQTVDARPDQAPATDEMRTATARNTVDDPPGQSARTTPHALVDLARRRARDGLTLPAPATGQSTTVGGTPRPATAATALDTAHRPTASSASPDPLQRPPASTAVTPESPAGSGTQTSADPDLSRPDPAPPARPNAPGAHETRRENETRLADIAWRHGVEPR